MNRSAIAMFGLVLIVGLAGLGCAPDPAADKPQAEVGEAQAAPESTEAAGTTLAFAEGSAVQWVGSKVTASHEGGFEAFEGEVHLVDGDPTASAVHVAIDTTSLWADDDKLAGHLKSEDFFDVEAHPTATFTSTSIEPAEAGYTVTGNLDLHGVTKSISFPAQITVEGDAVSVQAEFSIKRFDFGIEYPGRADDLIRDDVVIKLDLRTAPEATEAQT